MPLGRYGAGGQVPGGVCAWPHGCECTETCHGVDGAGAPPPAPAPSLVSGAIGRGLVDAREAYRAHLADVWHAVGESRDPGPWDD